MPLPFLTSQQLLVLKRDPKIDPQEAVHPERFRLARLGSEQGEAKKNANDQVWEPLAREDFNAGTRNGQAERLWVLTTDAGLGKSYNLVALQHELNHKPNLVFRFLIGDLEEFNDNDSYFESLVSRVHDASPEFSKAQIRRGLKQKQTQGQVVFLCDGLDQVSGKKAVARLVSLIKAWPQCRFVVAGRPFALAAHWEALFKPNARDWNYVQILEFTKQQQQQVLGEKRYYAIPRDARTILTVPRVLEYIAGIPEDELASLQTVSDVYWKATGHMLKKALSNLPEFKDGVDDITAERYQALLGAFAFAMYAEIPKESQGQPNLDRIPATKMIRFRKEKVYARLKRDYDTEYTLTEFQDDCRTLNRLNTFLSHGWMDTDACAVNKQDLTWRNASLQEFFSAYWISRWGKGDHNLLPGWIVNPLSQENQGFYWFWRYGAEMPDEVVWPDRDVGELPISEWQGAMAPLYAVPKPKKPVIRSTEIIFRSWERMKGSEAQEEFLGEFPEILKSNPIAKEFWAGFRLIDAGTCPYGSESVDDPGTPTHVEAFQMHQYPVTNEHYELFDPGHRDYRWKYWNDNPELRQHPLGDDSRCPVVNVSWYDAIVFAYWCGAALPTELQFEHALRVGKPGRYHFGDDEGLLKHYAWYHESYSTGSTHPVGNKETNANELYDLHGNVWEWSSEWSDEERLYKSVRGGSWRNFAWSCRAACRRRDEPDFRNVNSGFRLACLDFG